MLIGVGKVTMPWDWSGGSRGVRGFNPSKVFLACQYENYMSIHLHEDGS